MSGMVVVSLSVVFMMCLRNASSEPSNMIHRSLLLFEL